MLLKPKSYSCDVTTLITSDTFYKETDHENILISCSTEHEIRCPAGLRDLNLWRRQPFTAIRSSTTKAMFLYN